MNLMVEFTDVHYASKQEVADALGKHLADPIWNQLVEYRKNYMMKFGSVELCLCPGILQKINRCYEYLFQYQGNDEIKLEELLNETESLWLFQHYYKTSGDLHQRISDICLMFDHHCEKDLIELIKQTEIPEIAKLVLIILWFSKSEKCVLLLGCVLRHMGLVKLLSVICEDDLVQLLQKDATYALESVVLAWSKRMKIQIEKTSVKQVRSMKELTYLYPQLKDYQIQFYLDHHEPGFYYTIEQFISCSQVCYETGRCALKQMVDLGFYQMFKQGKKYVYTAR